MRRVSPPVDTPGLAPALCGLEHARAEAWFALPRAAAWRVGLLAGAGSAFWGWNRASGQPHALGDLAWTLGLSAAGGFVWAWTRLEHRYRARYRAEVLPLAVGAPGWAWRPAGPDLARLKSLNLLPRWDGVRTTGALVGEHRGYATTITALQLTRDVRGESDDIVFQGLLVSLALSAPQDAVISRSLRGGAAVVTDGVLHIALPTGREHFPAPGLLRHADDADALQRLRDDLGAVFQTVDSALGAPP